MTELLPGVAGPVVLTHQVDGYAVIPVPTPLTRLNFFDGRLLRGDDLTVEQNADRALLFALGRTGGPGVAHGLDVTVANERLTLSPGLAVDPVGRLLLLPAPMTVAVDDVLDATRGVAADAGLGGSARAAEFAPCEIRDAAPVADVAAGSSLYLLTLAWAEGLCGHAEVYGVPCEQACVTTTARPYRIDGVLLRLRPLQLTRPLPVSGTVLLDERHLRSRVAAAYFADERAAAGPPMSAALLSSESWCRGAPGAERAEVPLAVLARSGRTTLFADVWTARRELLDTPARDYGDGRLAMRARSVFAAHITQFQCQLAGLLRSGLPDSPADRILIDAGVVELPPAGYLPVDPARDLARQVGALLGPGVGLRFVPVPADQVPHEVEEVQHRDRISLLAGLDDPSARPEVDVLVPDGRVSRTPQVSGLGCLAEARLAWRKGSVEYRGVARFPTSATGLSLATAGFCTVARETEGITFVRSMVDVLAQKGGVTLPSPTDRELRLDHLRRLADEAGRFAAAVSGRPKLYAAEFDADEGKPIVVRGGLSCDRDLWRLRPGESAIVTAQLDLYAPYRGEEDREGRRGPAAALFEMFGRVEVSGPVADPGAVTRTYQFKGQLGADRGDNRPGAALGLQFGVTVTVTERPGVRRFAIRSARALRPDWSRVRLPRRLRADGVLLVLEVRDDGTVLLIPPDDTDGLSARFTPDPDALGPDHPMRLLGELSLGLLRGGRPAETEFYDRARADLFGSAVDDSGAPVVTATHDWVAFRRRRAERPAAGQPPARSVVVWVATAQDQDIAARWAVLLRGGRADGLPWQRVGTALFDPGTAKLRTDPDELRRGYTATGAPAMVLAAGYGAIGPLPAGRDRALAVTAALVPAAALDPQGAVVQLSGVPGGLLEPDSDGSVFLIACRPAPSKAGLLQVVGLDLDDDGDGLIEAVQQQDLRLVDERRTVLGTVRLDAAGTLDQRLFDTTLAETDRAVLHREVAESTPVLWLDPEWADAAPQAAELLVREAQSFVTRIQGHLGSQLRLDDDRIHRLPLASEERQAMLILCHFAQIG